MSTVPSAEPELALAARLLKAGRPEAAVVPLGQAAARLPADARVQHDFGLACLETGRLGEAVVAFQRAIAARPRYADAYFRLGMALEKLGDVGAAIRAYDQATELLPSLTEAWFRAGALVFTLGHKAEAAGCFRRAASSGPKTSFGRLGAARARLAEDRDGEAEKLLRQLLALEPGNAMAMDLLGNVLADSGRFDEARDWFARAMATAPLMAGSAYDLVRCRRIGEQDRDLLARLQDALAWPALDPAQKLRVHLALAKAADDLGEPAQAMHHCDAADTLRRRLMPFDTVGFDAQIDRMIALFTPEFMAQATAHGSNDATPVLVLGMPRSGTTLTEQILSSHPDVAAGGELNFWNERGIAWVQSGATEITSDFLCQAQADYLGVLRAIGPAARHVTDKMPFNFLWAGLIHAAFPNATLIHCRRAAIDTALSIHQTHFNPRVAFPTGGPELVAYFRTYDRLTAHWRRVLPAARWIDIDYAELTQQPEPTIRRMIAAAGLAWNAACLQPERNARVVKTPSRWQARQPIYPHAVARWRRYEPWLGPLRPLLS